MTSNTITLSSYERCADAYIEKTVPEIPPNLKIWIDTVLSGVPHSAKILEIGSGSGRDAAYMESLDYKVNRTDATVAFIKHLKNNGHHAELLNILTDELPDNSYDLIYANAVLLHFTHEELETIIQKIHMALKKNGKLAFTLKEGQGQEWSTKTLKDPRYFMFWTKQNIEQLIKNIGFINPIIEQSDGWLCVTIQRDS
jgi:SAM-dependent methyltransferase